MSVYNIKISSRRKTTNSTYLYNLILFIFSIQIDKRTMNLSFLLTILSTKSQKTHRTVQIFSLKKKNKITKQNKDKINKRQK